MNSKPEKYKLVQKPLFSIVYSVTTIITGATLTVRTNQNIELKHSNLVETIRDHQRTIEL